MLQIYVPTAYLFQYKNTQNHIGNKMLAFDLKGHGILHFFHSTGLDFFPLRYDIAGTYICYVYVVYTYKTWFFYAKSSLTKYFLIQKNIIVSSYSQTVNSSTWPLPIFL